MKYLYSIYICMFELLSCLVSIMLSGLRSLCTVPKATWMASTASMSSAM